MIYQAGDKITGRLGIEVELIRAGFVGGKTGWFVKYPDNDDERFVKTESLNTF